MALCRPGGLTGRYTSDSFFQNEELQRVDRRVVHILYPNSFGMRQSCFMSDKSTGIALCVPIIKLCKCLRTGDLLFDWDGAGFQAKYLTMRDDGSAIYDSAVIRCCIQTMPILIANLTFPLSAYSLAIYMFLGAICHLSGAPAVFVTVHSGFRTIFRNLRPNLDPEHQPCRSRRVPGDRAARRLISHRVLPSPSLKLQGLAGVSLSCIVTFLFGDS